MYVTYEYYTTTYGGSTISSTDFNKYERKARVFIDNVTFNRLQLNNALVIGSVQDAICEIMECNYKIDLKETETDGNIISSETVDGHSVTYAIADTEKNTIDKKQLNKVKYYNIAKEYLGNTGLLYRGI